MIVTDHAVIRYLERVWGVDVDALRTRIARQAAGRWTGSRTLPLPPERGEYRILSQGVRFQFRVGEAGETILTTITVNNGRCLSKRALRLRRKLRRKRK